MNKIHRLISLGAFLLMATNILAYNITITAPANGTLTLSDGTSLTGTASAGTTVTLIATPTPSLYYLEEIVIEPVIDLGDAQAPRRLAPIIPIPSKMFINKTTRSTEFAANVAQNYGGSYTFTMPDADVSITATFLSTTNFEGNNNITVAIGGTGTYDGDNHSLVVKNTMPSEVTLEEGTDFQITRRKIKRGTEAFTDVDAIKDAGTYEIEITGLGTYYNSKTVNTLVINKANLTITPKNKSRQYRDPNPTINYASADDVTYTGFQNGETHSVFSSPSNTPPTFTYSVNATVEASVATADSHTYTITASDAVAANYAISYSPGYLAITPRNVNDANTQAVATMTDATYAEFNSDQYYKYDPNSPVVHEPTVTVTDPSDSDHPLVNGTDFDVAYAQESSGYGDAEHKTPGMYTATISFKGNYTGSNIIKKYQIRKKVSLPYDWNTYYYTDVAMKVPTGMEAFTITSIAANQVVIRKQSYILKDMPMLLYSTSTDPFYPELVKVADATRVGADPVSDFIGIETDLDMAATASADNTHDYWILIDGSFVRTKSGTLTAHKCYLKRLKTQHATPSISLVKEYDSTGIDYVNNSSLIDDRIYYDLSGRRVQKPTKGLYIFNGKKIIIK